MMALVEKDENGRGNVGETGDVSAKGGAVIVVDVPEVTHIQAAEVLASSSAIEEREI